MQKVRTPEAFTAQPAGPLCKVTASAIWDSVTSRLGAERIGGIFEAADSAKSPAKCSKS